MSRDSSPSMSPPSSLAHRDRRTRSNSRSSSPHRHTLNSPTTPSFHPYPTTHSSHNTSLQALAPRSRWQQLMLEATTTAGSTAAVVSEEGMKCLRYCLSWLQYAVQHIDQQILILRDFLLRLRFNPSSTGNPSTSQQVAVPMSASQTLSQIKKEVIDTIRKVVEVVSRYAGATLPEQARKSVRTFILSLPGRWASLNDSRSSVPSSPASSPMLGPSYSSPSTPTFPRDTNGQPTVAHMHESGVKILNLAVESVDMLESVSNIFSDTIGRAESWLERLRLVGVGGLGGSSAAARDMSSFEDGMPSVVLPPIRNRPIRQRTKSPSPKYISSSSSDNEMESASEEESKRMPMLKKAGRKANAEKKKKVVPRKRVVPEDSGVDGDGMGMEGVEF